MYTSWSLDCPLSTGGTRVLLLYSQRRLSNFPDGITLFLALHQMVLDLLTPITTRPVSTELKNWCLVILGLGASAEDMAECVDRKSYEENNKGEQYSLFEVSTTIYICISIYPYRSSSPGSITAAVMSMNRLHMSIESLPPPSTKNSLDTRQCEMSDVMLPCASSLSAANALSGCSSNH